MIFSLSTLSSTLVLDRLLENFVRAATNFSAVLLRICPRRRRQPMRIKKSQCLFGVLLCQLLLPVCQIRFGEGLVRVSRFRISESDELQDLARQLRLVRAHVILA